MLTSKERGDFGQLWPAETWDDTVSQEIGD